MICANILIFCTLGAASRMMLVPLAVVASDGVQGCQVEIPVTVRHGSDDLTALRVIGQVV